MADKKFEGPVCPFLEMHLFVFMLSLLYLGADPSGCFPWGCWS